MSTRQPHSCTHGLADGHLPQHTSACKNDAHAAGLTHRPSTRRVHARTHTHTSTRPLPSGRVGRMGAMSPPSYITASTTSTTLAPLARRLERQGLKGVMHRSSAVRGGESKYARNAFHCDADVVITTTRNIILPLHLQRDCARLRTVANRAVRTSLCTRWHLMQTHAKHIAWHHPPFDSVMSHAQPCHI